MSSAFRNQPINLCRRCGEAVRCPRVAQARHFSLSRASNQGQTGNSSRAGSSKLQKDADAPREPELGPMARRLEEATEEAMLTGGKSGRRAIEEAGFSDELKEKLLDKLADAKFAQQYSGAFAQASLPSSAGLATRDIAAAQPWSGQETTEDAVLRMLDDARKPLKPGDRGKFQPPVIDTRIKRTARVSPGQMVANARDKANTYVGMDMKERKGLSDEEREEMKRELRERFQPAARSVPVSISAVASLANERIEDAIARGQFKNLPRGKEMERDYRADSPFIDTTEYIMNKMIQRQDMVPPWIEKQQELAKAVRVFRERLRNDWKRHTARMIASQGGSLDAQMKRAARFAEIELATNPGRKATTGEMTTPSSAAEPSPTESPGQQQTSATLESLESVTEESSVDTTSSNTIYHVFRDPAWEKAENAFLTLSVDALNSVTRSYNLMAPEIARKPYYSLGRELAFCYADVAPLVANEIKMRAIGAALPPKVNASGGSGGNLMEQLVGNDNVKIRLEADEKAYGLKEWWRDFWAKK